MKQVIVIRKDLNMRKGKIAAQAAHASIKAVLSGSSVFRERGEMCIAPCAEIQEWLNDGLQKKICVGVDSEAELLALYERALNDTDLPLGLIRDAGLTEFKEPTLTALAIGPGTDEDVDKLTGTLKLL
jgi:PTH2 family peptidyl-tRNA hydrolase